MSSSTLNQLQLPDSFPHIRFKDITVFKTETHKLSTSSWITNGPVGFQCDDALELLHTQGLQNRTDYIIRWLNLHTQQPFSKRAAVWTHDVKPWFCVFSVSGEQ